MTNVERLLASFDELSRDDQVLVAKEIRVRLTGKATEFTGAAMSDEELSQVADELFQMLDKEEVARDAGA